MKIPHPSDHRIRKGVSGFSLFEIVVAMAILGIISSSVFAILWQAGDTAAEIRELDQRDEEVARFLSLLRESIENLPPQGTLTMTPVEESSSGYPELEIGNSATGFTFGEIVGSSEKTVISLRPGKGTPEGEATFDLAISRGDFEPKDTDGSGMVFGAGADDFLQADEDGRYWLPLLTGITAASWSFWDDEGKVWIDEWTDKTKMPKLLAFSMDDTFRPVPLRIVFEVPEQASNPAAATPASTTPAAGSNTTGTSSDKGGRAGKGEGKSDGRAKGKPDGSGDRSSEGKPGGTRERPSGGRPGGGDGNPSQRRRGGGNAAPSEGGGGGSGADSGGRGR